MRPQASEALTERANDDAAAPLKKRVRPVTLSALPRERRSPCELRERAPVGINLKRKGDAGEGDQSQAPLQRADHLSKTFLEIAKTLESSVRSAGTIIELFVLASLPNSLRYCSATLKLTASVPPGA